MNTGDLPYGGNRYVIRDRQTAEFFRQSVGPKGWYSPCIADARFYTTIEGAKATIAKRGHHVTYPDRSLVVGIASIQYKGTIL